MSYVTLTSEDLEVLIDVTQHIVDYKRIALSESRWEMFENEYLPKLVDQLRDNKFRCFRANDNTFTWLADQIKHCKLVQPDLKREYWPNLDSISQVQQALSICQKAALGQYRYTSSCKQNNFNSLFKF